MRWSVSVYSGSIILSVKAGWKGGGVAVRLPHPLPQTEWETRATSTQWWLNAGPQSATLAHHAVNIACLPRDFPKIYVFPHFCYGVWTALFLAVVDVIMGPADEKPTGQLSWSAEVIEHTLGMRCDALYRHTVPGNVAGGSYRSIVNVRSRTSKMFFLYPFWFTRLVCCPRKHKAFV